MVRILVADDQKLICQSLGALFSSVDGFDVVGETCDGQDAVDRARRLLPDVVLMNVAMPVLNGPDATKAILPFTPATKVVAMSARADARQVQAMLGAGARGYLLTNCDQDECVRAIRLVADGGVYFTAAVADLAASGLLAHESPCSAQLLTGRERQILQLLAEGKGAKETGALLHVSSRTIDSHRQRIMRKLDAHSVAELTKWAVRLGLTTV